MGDQSACPTARALAGVKRIELWAEGADGKAHLEVKSIMAVPPAALAAAASSARPSAPFDICKGPGQEKLRFNISSRTTPDIPVAVDPTESLAEAVCCDNRTKIYAEPQFLYQAPDIA